MRWRILESTFIGYTVFYLVRNNFPVVSKEVGQALSYDKGQIGDILAIISITYGIGKFFMGALSDRSNPRIFMPFGLLLTAACNFLFGGTSDHTVHMILWGMNGLFQGMGWPPCGRSLGHWYSVKERGTVFAFWNIAHNVGGGLVGIISAYSADYWGWQSAFTVPGIISVVCAAYLYWRLRDTPQSVGLPPIEEFKNDYPANEKDDHERELTTKELIVDNILKNPMLWLFAAANFFVYIVRYSLIDWGPTYLKEAKHASLKEGGWSTFVFEFAGVASTILMGYLSDRLGGRRGMVSLLCMIPILGAIYGIVVTPEGMLWLDMVWFGAIGFFVYPPVMLLGVAGMDLTSKKAVGTAAGFIGLLGYLGKTVQGKALGTLSQTMGWNTALTFVAVCTALSVVLLAFTWKVRPRG